MERVLDSVPASSPIGCSRWHRNQGSRSGLDRDSSAAADAASVRERSCSRSSQASLRLTRVSVVIVSCSTSTSRSWQASRSKLPERSCRTRHNYWRLAPDASRSSMDDTVAADALGPIGLLTNSAWRRRNDSECGAPCQAQCLPKKALSEVSDVGDRVELL